MRVRALFLCLVSTLASARGAAAQVRVPAPTCPDLCELRTLDSLLFLVYTQKGTVDSTLRVQLLTILDSMRFTRATLDLEKLRVALGTRGVVGSTSIADAEPWTRQIEYEARLVPKAPAEVQVSPRCQSSETNSLWVSTRVLQRVDSQIGRLCKLMGELSGEAQRLEEPLFGGFLQLSASGTASAHIPGPVSRHGVDTECDSLRMRDAAADTTWISWKAARGIGDRIVNVCRSAFALTRRSGAGMDLRLRVHEDGFIATRDSMHELLAELLRVKLELERVERLLTVIELRTAIQQVVQSTLSANIGVSITRCLPARTSTPASESSTWRWSTPPLDSVRRSSREVTVMAVAAGNDRLGGGIVFPAGLPLSAPSGRGYVGAFGNVIEAGVGPERTRLGALGHLGVLLGYSYDHVTQRGSTLILALPPQDGPWRLGGGISTSGVVSVLFGRSLQWHRRDPTQLPAKARNAPCESARCYVGCVEHVIH